MPRTPIHRGTPRPNPRWRNGASKARSFTSSVQVLREYLAVTTRPDPGQTTSPDYQAILQNTASFRAAFHVLEGSETASEELEKLVQKFSVQGRQVHDANIVATMRMHGVGDLFTHNVSDFTRFAPLITVHPLAAGSKAK